MRHLALALAACIALPGSVADAAPRGGRHAKAAKKPKHRVKIAPPVDETEDTEEADEAEEAEAPAKARLSGSGRRRAARETIDSDDDDTDEAEAPSKPGKRSRTARATFDREDDDLADEEEVDIVMPPVKVRRVAAKRANDWHLAIGPYLWASSVDANVSLGGASVSSGVDFAQITRHARYGAELLTEVRYGRFSIANDFMYGVVDLSGDKTVGPLMVNIHGTASSLLVDGTAGYMLTGGDHSLLSIEARAGVRYQRTSIEASVGISGSDVASTEKVMAGADAIAGGRVFVRPFNRFYFSSTFDIGTGSSSLTWSVAADASARLTSRVLLSVGYRTLTLDGASVSMVMHGPRAAVQLVF